MKINRIDDVAWSETVYDVYHSAAKNKRNAEFKQPAVRTFSKQSGPYPTTDDDPDRDKTPPLPAPRIRQKPKCHTLI
mgnify:CR=1 FL=1